MPYRIIPNQKNILTKTLLKAAFRKKGGPSDRIRTCGILLPKQARYQLRYTRINAMQILAHFFKNCNAFFPIDVSGALWYIFIL